MIMKKRKKKVWIFVIGIIVIVTATALLVSCQSKEDYGNRIVIKRIDGKGSLRMPHIYVNKILSDKSLFSEDIEKFLVSSVRIRLDERNFFYGYPFGVLAKTENTEEEKKIIRAIEYCKGITDIDVITNEKKDCEVTFYEGFNAAMMQDKTRDCVIMPSSVIKFIKPDLAPQDRRIIVTRVEGSSIGTSNFTIIGEYTAKDKYDTIYVSYSGLARIFTSAESDVSEFVDSLEIKLFEGRDGIQLMEYLDEYFADANALEKYKGKTDRYGNPYIFKYEHYPK